MYLYHQVSLINLFCYDTSTENQTLGCVLRRVMHQPDFEGSCICKESWTGNSGTKMISDYNCDHQEFVLNFLMPHHGKSLIQQCTVHMLCDSILLKCISTCHSACSALSCKESRKIRVEKLSSAVCTQGFRVAVHLVPC